MSLDISYDTVGRYFFCEGHVLEQDFLEALWEQWDTDFSSLNIGKSGVYQSYARWSRGNPGYWRESQSGRGSKPITVVKGSVVGLGPESCSACGSLMALKSATVDMETESEFWLCPSCRSEMDIRRPR
jgi:hypothetical protein